MRYIGHRETHRMPFEIGETVLIPKGVRVSTMHPNRSGGLSKQNRQIVIHHFLPGQEVPIVDALRYHKDNLLKTGVDIQALEDDVRSGKCDPYELIPVSNPKVCWAGTGGYWCEAELNDILAANGLDDRPESAQENDSAVLWAHR